MTARDNKKRGGRKNTTDSISEGKYKQERKGLCNREKAC